MVRTVHSRNSPWYEKSIVRIVQGTNSPSIVRIVQGTNSPRYEVTNSPDTEFFGDVRPANRIFSADIRPAANFSADYGQHFSGGFSAYFGLFRN